MPYRMTLWDGWILMKSVTKSGIGSFLKDWITKKPPVAGQTGKPACCKENSDKKNVWWDGANAPSHHIEGGICMLRLTPQRRQTCWAFIFLAPTLFLFVLLVIYPFIDAFNLSLQEWTLFRKGGYIGWENYRTMFQDELVGKSLVNTLYWTVGVVPGILVFSMALALILNIPRLKAKGVFRTVYFVPVITNMVAASFVWRWLFEPTFGVVNYFLSRLGLPEPGWLASTNWALPAMIIVGIWKQIGFA